MPAKTAMLAKRVAPRAQQVVAPGDRVAQGLLAGGRSREPPVRTAGVLEPLQLRLPANQHLDRAAASSIASGSHPAAGRLPIAASPSSLRPVARARSTNRVTASVVGSGSSGYWCSPESWSGVLLVINWQATSKDMINFLFFNGDKIKEGRAPGAALFEPTSARWNQGNYYTDNPFHGLWKIENNRVFSNSLFVTGKYAYTTPGSH